MAVFDELASSSSEAIKIVGGWGGVAAVVSVVVEVDDSEDAISADLNSSYLAS